MADLEEERRKLRAEVKFRAKYHGKAALEMGLTSEQLLLLEEYVEGLKGGRNPDAGVVAQMQQRVEFLEVRLAEVMAYADIPINMRPALSELDGGRLPADAAAVLQHRGPAAGSAGAGGGTGPFSGPALAHKLSQAEQMRGAMSTCLGLLNQMSDALGECRACRAQPRGALFTAS